MLTGGRQPHAARLPARAPLVRALLAFGLVAFAATGCVRADSEDDRPVPAVPGGAYSVALTEPDHLTPGRTTSSYALQVLQGVFDTPSRWTRATATPSRSPPPR